MSNDARAPEHIDASEFKGSQPGENTEGAFSNVVVNVPETITIKMVQANVLGDYELWALLTSILLSALVGFVVAFLQSGEQGPVANYFFWTAVVIGICALVTLFAALWKRSLMRQRGKDIRLKVTSASVD